MSGKPTTRSGDRLLWMVATQPERPDRPNGRRYPAQFSARLVERICEEFVPRIEEDAVADFVRGEFIETIVADAVRKTNDREYAEGERPTDVATVTRAVLAALREYVA